MIAAFVLWSLADLVIYPVVYSKFGSDWPAVALRICISGCVGFSLLFLLTGIFGAVQVDDEKLSK